MERRDQGRRNCIIQQNSVSPNNFLEHHSLRRRRIREVNHRGRSPSSWPSKPLGSYQCRRRESLRIRVPPQLPHPHSPPRPHRDDIPNPLRDLPRQATSRLEGEQHCRRTFGKQTYQPRCGAGAQPKLPANDNEWILS
jgi:hypothetical protein